MNIEKVKSPVKKTVLLILCIAYFFICQITGTIIALINKLLVDPNYEDRLIDSLENSTENTFEYIDCIMELVPVTLLSASLLIIIPVIIYWIATKQLPYKNPFKQGLSKEIKPIIGTISLAIFLNLLINLIISGLPQEIIDNYNSQLSGITNMPLLIAILLTGILVPITEEITFRYYIFKIFKNKQILAIIISSISFGVVHGNVIQSTYAILLGFIMGYMYYKTENLLYNTLFHITVNSSSLIFEHFSDLTLTIIMIISGLIVFYSGYKFLKACPRNTLKKNNTESYQPSGCADE